MASRPSRNRMTAAWIKADDMNRARVSNPAVLSAARLKSRGEYWNRSIQHLSPQAGRDDLNVLLREPPRLQHGQGEHDDGGRLVRQRERYRNLMQQGQDTETGLHRDGCREPDRAVDHSRSG